jgi:hypothetical protein
MQIAIIIIALVLALVGAVFFFKSEKAEAPEATPTPIVENAPVTAPVVPTETPTQPAASSAYKNGTYSATGAYASPAGKETVDVTITLADDVVTAATFKGNATNPGSVNNQGKFAAGFEKAVVGKKLSDIKLTVVNGSSLTPQGFMDALAQIKTEAK